MTELGADGSTHPVCPRKAPTCMFIETITQPKGGVGASTVAVGLALLAAERGSTTVTLVDPRRTGNHAAILGLPIMGEDASLYGIRLTDTVPDTGGIVIVDAGPDPDPELIARSQRTTLVVRTSYLAMRRATAMMTTFQPDRVVVVRHATDSLTVADVTDVLGIKEAVTIDHTPAVARAIDAGLFPTRLPAQLSTALRFSRFTPLEAR